MYKVVADDITDRIKLRFFQACQLCIYDSSAGIQRQRFVTTDGIFYAGRGA